MLGPYVVVLWRSRVLRKQRPLIVSIFTCRTYYSTVGYSCSGFTVSFSRDRRDHLPLTLVAWQSTLYSVRICIIALSPREKLNLIVAGARNVGNVVVFLINRLAPCLPASVRASNFESQHSVALARWHVSTVAGLHDHGRSRLFGYDETYSQHSNVHPSQRNLRQGFGKERDASGRHSNVSSSTRTCSTKCKPWPEWVEKC